MSNARTLASLIDGSNIVVPSGYGLDFSSNANLSGMTSEVLDDYEEGSWTADVSAPSATISSSVTYAKYRKVGSVVFVDIVIVLSSSSGSGNVNVSLPFSFSNNGAFVGNSRTNGKSLSCLLQSATTSFDFYRYDGSTAIANETYAITGFYFTN